MESIVYFEGHKSGGISMNKGLLLNRALSIKRSLLMLQVLVVTALLKHYLITPFANPCNPALIKIHGLLIERTSGIPKTRFSSDACAVQETHYRSLPGMSARCLQFHA